MAFSDSSAPCVHIVILNWNGWKDTIECLESLQKIDYTNYRIVIVDNASQDDSIDRIACWAGGTAFRDYEFQCGTSSESLLTYSREEAEEGGIPSCERKLTCLPPQNRLVLIKNSENLGYAGGCNVGIRYALAADAKYIWLLNNDTVVEPDALWKLVEFLELHNEYNVATGQIRYYYTPELIWNCGGMLTWYGCRKYDYGDRPVASAPKSGFKRITYITGCAALYRSKMLRAVGILTEKFFFGEEDFEMAMRTRKLGCNVQACVYGSIIYHKVGSSINKASSGRNLGKIYVHYLNRFIDVKNNWPYTVWLIWRILYLLYILPLLKIKWNADSRQLWVFVVSLLDDSKFLNQVDKKMYLCCIEEHWLRNRHTKCRN